jgi:gliding motility-associated protein GldM
MKESDLQTVDGKPSFREDDLDASTRLMDTKGRGKELHDKLAQFKTSLMNVLPADKRGAVGELPINLETPKSSNEASNKDWSTAYFHMTPTVASLTMLSKFQNDVKRSGNLVADVCAQQLGKVEVVYDNFDVLIGQNSQYLMPGQPFELTAGLGTYSSAAKPTVTVNGSSVALDASGRALYKETSGGPGTKNFNVSVSFKDPNTGETKTKTTTVSYTVGQPSGAAIFLEKMNVVYIGVDNPISVSGGSAGMEKTSVNFTGGGLSGNGGHYVIHPGASAQGDQTLNVTVEGKTTAFTLRVKRLPPPSPFVGTYTGGTVPAAAFRAMGGVRAQLVGSDFQAPYTVLGYTVAGNVNGSYSEVPVSGGQWGGNPIIANAKPGSLVSIFNIRAQGPDGSPIKLQDMAFRLQ